MGGAFEWIGWVAEWLGKFFPRWLIIRATHGGVKFVHGARIVPLGPGVHWYWPVVTEIDTYPVARQAVDLATQIFVTADGHTVAVGGMLVYEVKDVAKLLGQTFVPDNSIKDITAGAIHDVCCLRTWEELKRDQRSGALDRDLRQKAAKVLDSYGVKVLRTTLTDLAPARVLKIIQSTSKDG